MTVSKFNIERRKQSASLLQCAQFVAIAVRWQKYLDIYQMLGLYAKYSEILPEEERPVRAGGAIQVRASESQASSDYNPMEIDSQPYIPEREGRNQVESSEGSMLIFSN